MEEIITKEDKIEEPKITKKDMTILEEENKDKKDEEKPESEQKDISKDKIKIYQVKKRINQKKKN